MKKFNNKENVFVIICPTNGLLNLHEIVNEPKICRAVILEDIRNGKYYSCLVENDSVQSKMIIMWANIYRTVKDAKIGIITTIEDSLQYMKYRLNRNDVGIINVNFHKCDKCGQHYPDKGHKCLL